MGVEGNVRNEDREGDRNEEDGVKLFWEGEIDEEYREENDEEMVEGGVMKGGIGGEMGEVIV